jgi:integrase
MKKSTRGLPLGSLHIHRSGLFYWRYYFQGKRKERSTGSHDRQDAFIIAKKWAIKELAIRSNLIRIPQDEEDGVCVAKASADYFRSAIPSWTSAYKQIVAHWFEDWIVPFFGASKSIHEINSIRIAEFTTSLLEKKLSPSTINKVLCQVRRMFRYCAINGIIDSPPIVQNLKKQDKDHGRVLSDYERKRLLIAACRIGKDALNFVALGLYCGLRKSEALSLEWKDIDWKNDLIKLERQKNRTCMPAPFGVMREILEDVPKNRRKGRIVCYFDVHTGDRRPALRLEKTWKRIKKDARIQGRLRYHDLRHTFIDWAYKNLSPAIAPVLARHSSREATARYIHLERVQTMPEARKMYKDNNSL